MRAVFETLYVLHPVAPALFLVVMVNGLVAPAVFTAVAKLPYNIGKVRALAKAGSLGAKYAYYSWLAFAASAVVTLFTAFLA